MASLTLTCAALTCVTIITRCGPLLFGEWLLRQSWSLRLSNRLPCMVFILLLLHILEPYALPLGWKTLTVICAIGGALIAETYLQVTIISLAVAVALYVLLATKM